MKILFFVSGLGAGGKERRLIELLKELKNNSAIEFELVVMSHDIHYEEILTLNIQIHYLIRKFRKDPTIIIKFYKLCRAFNPDIVHCWDSMSAIFCTPVSRFLGIKLVNGMVTDAQIQGSLFNENRVRAFITFPFSDKIVGNSKAGILAYSVPENKGVVIYNGFNFKRIERLQSANKIRMELDITTKYIVGMVATFSKYKDYGTYFGAAKTILDRGIDVTFLAIGYKTDSTESINMIEDKYYANFRLLGTKSGVESYVNVMDVCVLSTFTEGISNSVLEYMALGKPVVATDGGGTKKIIVDTKTGYLVKVSDVNDLANKIETILLDNNLLTKMGEEGEKRIRKVFSIENMINSYIELYKNVLS